MIDPDDFRVEPEADLSHIIDSMPVDYKKGGWASYTPEQLRLYSEAKRDEELRVLFILDIVLSGLTLIFFMGAYL
jgi:hypothetical protein